MISWPTVALIVVNWNGRRLLDTCLRSLLAVDYPAASVILVDNASSDGSADYVGEHYPGVQVIQLEQNRGYGGGANAGLRANQAGLAVILNVDIEVPPDWLR